MPKPIRNAAWPPHWSAAAMRRRRRIEAAIYLCPVAATVAALAAHIALAVTR